MTYIGIDPGASGAMAIIPEQGEPILLDFKTEGIRGYAANISHLLGEQPHLTIAVELVHAMPGQGVSSMFSFGQRLGELHGMLQTLELEWHNVRPQAWQKHCGVISKSGKKGIHSAISTIYPNAPLVGPKGGIKDGRCDALGIAHYIKETT